MGRIDTHQHLVPDFYAEWVDAHGLNGAGLPLPAWSPDAALAMMDRLAIDAAVLSVSTPGVHRGDGAEARIMARRVNTVAAELVRAHPSRFGFFATLTLPDVEGALAEAAYAFDELGADGVVLLANVRGQYLGDPAFEPLFAELGRRSAVVLVHPSFLPCAPVPGVPPFLADFLLDTTRAAINLVVSGTFERHPGLRVILSHAGGFVPYASYRIAPRLAADIERGADLLRAFWFDTALSGSPASLPSLQAFADPSRILFGTDWPFAPEPTAAWHTAQVDALLTPAAHADVMRGNATALFPRLAGSGS